MQTLLNSMEVLVNRVVVSAKFDLLQGLEIKIENKRIEKPA